jgi:hypothetical protein
MITFTLIFIGFVPWIQPDNPCQIVRGQMVYQHPVLICRDVESAVLMIPDKSVCKLTQI